MLQFLIKLIKEKEDVILHIACAKPPESLCQVPKGSKATGIRVNVEFYEDEEKEGCQTTKWYKGAIIAYSKRRHVVTFDGYGPEHNDIIR